MTTLHRAGAELPLALDRSGREPLTSQIVGQLRTAMADGLLAAGERLPSSRALAVLLGVSRTVVSSAYTQLFAEGWIEGRHGSGTYVCDGAPGGPPAGPGGAAPGTRERWAPGTGEPGTGDGAVPGTPLVEMRPGIAWAQGIDGAAWRRAWRTASSHMPGGLPDPRGLPSLRAALTGYLRRARGVRCAPDEILVTRGVAGSLGVIAATLLRPGDLVGVEEPGYPAARAVFAAHGARVVGCRVDADGLVVDDLPAGLRLVYTTPAHQYPLGGRLPVPRRRALIAWARATGALVAEDDYDGEFRYDVAPLPTLYGLDPEVVIYLGTTTKTLTPALRVGWLAARPGLVSRLAGTAAACGEGAGEAAQWAVHTMIATGDLERHVRRMRHTYARRRAVVAAGLGGQTAGRLLGDEAGMHMVLLVGEEADHVAMAARRHGVAVGTLTRYTAGQARWNGLVLGYGGATVPDLAFGCRVLSGLVGGPP